MTNDDLDRMDATARNGSAWPESTQSRADVLTLTAEVRRLAAERDETLRLARAEWERLRTERDYLRAAIVEYDAAKLCLARFHPHHRTHTEAGQSAVRRVVDAEAALRALAEVPRG